MKAYKGFNKDMTCRGFQFVEGQTYHVDEAKICESGFHACEDPLDCLGYYPPAKSVYHEVELDEVSDERGDDTKVCAKTIKIGADIGIPGLVAAHIEYVRERSAEAGAPQEKHSSKDLGAASATGNRGAASATGNRGAASATGYLGAASATGYQGAASATGNLGAASATGNRGAASATGKAGVATAAGRFGRVRGAVGCAIFAVERGDWNGQTYPIIAVAAGIVDGDRIKADTWYTVKDGHFVEVQDA